MKWSRRRLAIFIECHFEEATVHLCVSDIHETFLQFVQLSFLDLPLQVLHVVYLFFLLALLLLSLTHDTSLQFVLLLLELFLFGKSVLLCHLVLLAHLLALEVTRLRSLALSSLVARIQLFSRHLETRLKLLLNTAIERSVVCINPTVTELVVDEFDALRLAVYGVVCSVSLLREHIVQEVAEVHLGNVIGLQGQGHAGDSSLT